VSGLKVIQYPYNLFERDAAPLEDDELDPSEKTSLAAEAKVSFWAAYELMNGGGVKKNPIRRFWGFFARSFGAAHMFCRFPRLETWVVAHGAQVYECHSQGQRTAFGPR
jgi:hypothetical protein